MVTAIKSEGYRLLPMVERHSPTMDDQFSLGLKGALVADHRKACDTPIAEQSLSMDLGVAVINFQRDMK